MALLVFFGELELLLPVYMELLLLLLLLLFDTFKAVPFPGEPEHSTTARDTHNKIASVHSGIFRLSICSFHVYVDSCLGFWA